MDRIRDFEVNSPRWLSLEDFEGEVWKPVVNYESLYEISNYGRIKCLPKVGRPVFIKKVFLAKSRNKYWLAELYKNNIGKRHFLHRLVATAFVPNPNNLPQVNHKDEDKTNPIASNLEWCNQKYNSNYGTMPDRIRRMKYKTIHQYSIKGEYIATYSSLKEAGATLGISPSRISAAVRGIGSGTAKGYLWTYTKDEKEIERKKKKISFPTILAETGFFRRNKSFPIEQYTLDDKYISTYRSANAAAKANGFYYGSILRCAKGKSNQYKGYKWKFAKQYEHSR